MSRQMAHRDKRQRRNEVTPERGNGFEHGHDESLDPCIYDWVVQQRLIEAARTCFERHFEVRGPAALFTAKTAVAAWRVLQMDRPLCFCFDWVALLVVCCMGVDFAFHDRSPQDAAEWSKTLLEAMFDTIAPFLGMPAAEFKQPSSAATHKFVMASREWARVDLDVKFDAVFNTHRTVHKEQRRDALFRAVLSPCVRAHLLFAP